MTTTTHDNPRSEAARLMGSARSARKAKTSAENGKKGGRPKKIVQPPPEKKDDE